MSIVEVTSFFVKFVIKSREITKEEWIEKGGCSNPNLFRKMLSGKWKYYTK